MAPPTVVGTESTVPLDALLAPRRMKVAVRYLRRIDASLPVKCGDADGRCHHRNPVIFRACEA